VRDIATNIRIAVGRNDPVEPDPVLHTLDGRRQPLDRLVDLAYDAAGHRKDPDHPLRVDSGHHPPSPGDLVELVGWDAFVPALVQAQQQGEVFLRHKSRLGDGLSFELGDECETLRQRFLRYVDNLIDLTRAPPSTVSNRLIGHPDGASICGANKRALGVAQLSTLDVLRELPTRRLKRWIYGLA